MSFNLRLDESTHDIVIGRGAERTEGLALTKQLVKCRLLTVLGEWSPDTLIGLPWFTEVMVKGQKLSVIEGMVRDCILGTDHVLEVQSLTLSLNKDNRVLTIDFIALSDWGLFESSTNLSVGNN